MTDKSDAIRAAEDRYRQATRKVEACLGMKNGGASAESSYADAYQELVKLGVCPQLRGKYKL